MARPSLLARGGAVTPLLLLLAAAAGAANYGRVTEPHEVVLGAIDPVGDADDLVFEGAPGFKVSAAVKAAKGTDLAPVLELIAPDGTLETRELKARATSRSAKVAATLLEEGRYAFRVRGASGSGAFSLKWKLKQAKVDKLKKAPLAGNTTILHPFAATGGARVSWSLKFQGDGNATVTRILDPDGKEVPFDEDLVVRSPKGTSEKGVGIPLTGPGGMYSLEVFNELAPVTANLSVKVTLPKEPTEEVQLSVLEPSLSSISPFQGGCGQRATLTGAHFGESPRAVAFGPNAATDLIVEDSKTVTCTIPAGSGTVDIVFEAEDGQVAVLEEAFTFDPPPTLLYFDPTVGPGVGGTPMTIRGNGFLTGAPDLYEVRVGGVNASQVVVVDSTTITCKSPAHVSGPKAVEVVDRCGQTFPVPGEFTYGSGLFVTIVRPSAVPTFGGIEVTISGSGLSAGDTVYLDGNPVASTPVTFSGQVIAHSVAAVPAHAPGAVDVEVRSPGGAKATKTGGLEYYGFEDITATAIPAASATDDWGAVSSALLDRDGDGTVDWIVLTHTAALSATRPGTRVLQNDGNGVFADVTATAMPAVTATEDFAGNAVLAARLNGDGIPDLYLSRPGSGVAYDQDGDGTPDWNEARLLAGNKHVDPWGRLLFPDGSGQFASQVVGGPTGLLAISGILVCNATWACAGEKRGSSVCFLFDADFRSDAAAMGDLDGDFDQDVILLNRSSLASFTGTSVGTWASCYGYSRVDYQYYDAKSYGSAMRILTTSGNGGLTDRTKSLMETPFSSDDDFRAVAATVSDMDGDFLNDILIVHDEGLSSASGPLSAARHFRQKNTGSTVSFKKVESTFRKPSSASDDDWRADSIAAADLNNDLKKDVVLSLNGALPGGGAFSTRILLQHATSGEAQDKTESILSGVLPEGDDGRATHVIARDLDRDGDQDLILCTPDSVGAGNRRTRYLLNIGRDEVTGYPVFLDASGLFPDAATEPGNAVTVALGDVDGDGHLDLVLTDTHETGGTPSRRTRIFRQVRE